MPESPRQTAARYDKPNTPRYNLVTALQALSKQLPDIPLARTTIGTDEGAYTLPDLAGALTSFLPETANPIEHIFDIGAPLLGAAVPFVAKKLGAMKMRPRPMAAKSRLVNDMGDLDPNRGKAEWLGGDPDYSRIKGIYDPDTDTIGLNRDLWMGADQQSRMDLLRHEDGHALWGNLSKESQAEMDMWAKDFQQSRRDAGYLAGEGVDAPTNGQELWAEIWRAAQTGEGWDEYAGVFDGHVKEAIRGGRKSIIPEKIKGFHGGRERFGPEEGYPMGRFKDQFLRSGEGAMVRGHGHYLGEVPDVGRGYRDRGIGSDSEMHIANVPIDEFYERQRLKAMDATDIEAYDLENEKVQLLEDLMLDGDLYGIEERAALGSYSDEAMEWFNKEIAGGGTGPGNFPQFNRKGRLYETEIDAVPEEFLVHDHAFSEQSPQVQEALEELILQGGMRWSGDFDVSTTRLGAGGDFEQSTTSILRWTPDDVNVEARIEQLKVVAEEANTALGKVEAEWSDIGWKAGEWKSEADAILKVRNDRDAAEKAFTDYVDNAQAETGTWGINPDATGQQIAQALEQVHRTNGLGTHEAAEAAMEELKGLGVKGFKFYDQESRNPFKLKIYNAETGAALGGGEFSSRKAAEKAIDEQRRGLDFQNRRHGVVLGEPKYDADGFIIDEELPKYKFEIKDLSGDATSNYVIFDPDNIHIKRVFGLAGAGVGLQQLTKEQRDQEQ